MTIGRIGYNLRNAPNVLTYQDFDHLEIDLAAGEVRFERLGQRTSLMLEALGKLVVHMPKQRDAVIWDNRVPAMTVYSTPVYPKKDDWEQARDGVDISCGSVKP